MVRSNNFYGVSHQGRGDPLSAAASFTLTTFAYDKRALSCSDPLPLSQSLLQVMQLTGVGRLNATLCSDGGLELIVRAVLKALQRLHTAPRKQRKHWETCIIAGVACLTNIAIRGNQKLRGRLVEAGTLSVLAGILGDELKLTQARLPVNNNGNDGRAAGSEFRMYSHEETTPSSPMSQSAPATQTTFGHTASSNAATDESQNVSPPAPTPTVASGSVGAPAWSTSVPYYQMTHPTLLPALKLIAYLSKYPNIRQLLHANLTFARTQHYTLPTYHPELRQWAVLCMRNAFKKTPLAIVTPASAADMPSSLQTSACARSLFASAHSNDMAEPSTPTTNAPILHNLPICAEGCAQPSMIPTSSSSLVSPPSRPAPAHPLRTCGNIGTHGSENPQCLRVESLTRKFHRCSRCRKVVYCSRRCQLNSWVYHRFWCIKFDTRNIDEDSDTYAGEMDLDVSIEA
ncbi:uncharacterized protein EV422DRAFT_520950 [Fimicolochytrium jonesii]|uniref:uncharacterized protein n=1 Tax=Fimicolochytrium jonesii TaxID=1396493 RepID=UPI0022FF0060|nr:uncharacterized protein EV422DRAFT_520950 [Fimicolochytrium jonesii]KAI8823415.1 hypothetical protein EV422DRAFT_520950 [Fimicolochytrium jonesii]